MCHCIDALVHGHRERRVTVAKLTGAIAFIQVNNSG